MLDPGKIESMIRSILQDELAVIRTEHDQILAAMTYLEKKLTHLEDKFASMISYIIESQETPNLVHH